MFSMPEIGRIGHTQCVEPFDLGRCEVEIDADLLRPVSFPSTRVAVCLALTAEL